MNTTESRSSSSGGGLCGATDDSMLIPDACAGNEYREERLLHQQRRNEAGNNRYYGDNRNPCQRFIERDKVLIVAILLMILFMNVSLGRMILYPFSLLATWVHEMCHGMAAKIVGGGIAELHIFEDGSGLAYTWTDGNTGWKRGFVASAGYPGTAVVGTILLLFRRTTLGPTIGTITLGLLMILSCILYVRNQFGLIVLSLEGVALVLIGWFVNAEWVDNVFAFVAATCSFNAVESIHDLFMPGMGYVNGERMYSDAHTVAEYWGGDYRLWASIWFLGAILLSVLGLVFALDARRVSTRHQAEVTPATAATTTTMTTASVPMATATVVPASTSGTATTTTTTTGGSKLTSWFSRKSKAQDATTTTTTTTTPIVAVATPVRQQQQQQQAPSFAYGRYQEPPYPVQVV